MDDPPIFPSINIPDQVIPEPPNLPRAILELPRGKAPSYIPMLSPPENLRPPVGVAKEGEEDAKESHLHHLKYGRSLSLG